MATATGAVERSYSMGAMSAKGDSGRNHTPQELAWMVARSLMDDDEDDVRDAPPSSRRGE